MNLIIDTKTKKKYSIFSKEGKKLLKNYINTYNSLGGNEAEDINDCVKRFKKVVNEHFKDKRSVYAKLQKYFYDEVFFPVSDDDYRELFWMTSSIDFCTDDRGDLTEPQIEALLI